MENEGKDGLKEAAQWIVALLIAVLAVWILRSFVVSTTSVKGVSMEPGLYHGDIVLVNQLAYRLGEPKRQEIVVCAYDNGVEEEAIIKRVIGIPGDTIDIEEDLWEGELRYRVVRNGEVLDEPYLNEIMQQKGDITYPFTVPEDTYFVMGDNRNFSSDSRTLAIGVIPKKAVTGKASFVLYPLKNMKQVK